MPALPEIRATEPRQKQPGGGVLWNTGLSEWQNERSERSIHGSKQTRGLPDPESHKTTLAWAEFRSESSPRTKSCHIKVQDLFELSEYSTATCRRHARSKSVRAYSQLASTQKVEDPKDRGLTRHWPSSATIWLISGRTVWVRADLCIYIKFWYSDLVFHPNFNYLSVGFFF